MKKKPTKTGKVMKRHEKAEKKLKMKMTKKNLVTMVMWHSQWAKF